MPNKIEEYLSKALQIAHSRADLYQEAVVLNVYSNLIKQKQPTQSSEYVAMAQKIFKKLNIHEHPVNLYTLI